MRAIAASGGLASPLLQLGLAFVFVYAALTLLAIVAVKGHAFEVLFRNVAIACAALALASMSGGSRRGHNVARAGDVAQVA